MTSHLATVSNPSLLPRSAGVYVLMSADEVLYVGESRNLRKRWIGHDLRGFVGLPGVSLRYECCSDHKAREMDLIKTLRPSLNGRTKGRWTKRESIRQCRPMSEVAADAMGSAGRRALESIRAAAIELGLSL